MIEIGSEEGGGGRGGSRRRRRRRRRRGQAESVNPQCAGSAADNKCSSERERGGRGRIKRGYSQQRGRVTGRNREEGKGGYHGNSGDIAAAARTPGHTGKVTVCVCLDLCLFHKCVSE